MSCSHPPSFENVQSHEEPRRLIPPAGRHFQTRRLQLMSPSQLPLEAARRLTGLAVRAAGGAVFALPEPSAALEPRFSWLGVALRAPLGADADVVKASRALGDALRLLTLVAACPGFGLQENAEFWSQELGEEPMRQPVPSWARSNWSQRRPRPRPRVDVRHLRFRLLASDQGAGYARDAGFVMQALEVLSQDVASESGIFDDAVEELRPWIKRERLPDAIECGVEVREQDLKRIRRILRGWKTHDKQVDEFRIPLVVEELFFSMPHCVEQQQALSDLTSLMKEQLPAHLGEFSLRIGTKHQRASDQNRKEALQTMMWTAVQERKGSSSWSFDLVDTSMASVVLSAFLSLTSGDRVRMAFTGNTPQGIAKSFIWRWLALTVFHESSPCGIQDLSIEKLQLSMDDVQEIMGAMTNSWNGGMLSLLGVHESAETTPSHCGVLVAKVMRGTRIEPRPVRELFGRPLATLAHEQAFPVLAVHSEWVCVQLPGYGHGYVQHSAVITMESQQSDSERRLKSLTLQVTDASAAIALLRLIGSTIENLTLKCNTFQRDHVPELLESCPHMTTLRICSTQLNDISEIVAASVKGRTALVSLALQTPTLDSNCIKKLCLMLMNREQARGCSLKELSLAVKRLRNQDLETVLAMLDVNRTLRFMHVCIPFDLFESYFPRFQAHRGVCIRDEEESRRTFAFLSAIGYYSKSSSILEKADPEVVAQILAFAGAKMRSISVEEITDGMTLGQIRSRTVVVGDH